MKEPCDTKIIGLETVTAELQLIIKRKTIIL